MGKFWAGLTGWFQGRKTILGGALVAVGSAAGVATGKLDPVSGVTLFGFGLSIAGYGAKANRHQAELLTALQGVAQIGADVRTGKPVAGDLAATLGQLAPAAAEYAVGYGLNAGGASIQISAATKDELLDAVTRLTAHPVGALAPRL